MTDNLATKSPSNLAEQHAEGVQSAKERVLLALGSIDGIREVEDLVRSKLDSEAQKLHEVSSYLIELGGKRMRPILSLLCYALFTEARPDNRIVDVSAGIELIHAATLLHDDIIDKSPRRRNQTSPYLKYGIPATLLSGDFLLVRAFSLCARLDRFIIDETEKSCIELTEGEILETPLFEEDHTLESYLTIARKKTAALFRLAAVSGAHLGLLQSGLSNKLSEKQSADLLQNMSDFGEHLGISFQIIDDMLDVIADENLLGKKSGVDLHERKPTAVNILWLQSGDPLAKNLKAAPKTVTEEDQFIEEALRSFRSDHNPVISEVRELAKQYTAKASDHLQRAADISGNYDRDKLQVIQLIIDYTLSRIQ